MCVDRRGKEGRCFLTARCRWPVGLLLLLPVPALAAAGHVDPIAPVILGVTGILFFAVLGRFLARRVGQPSVLGELLMGVAIGNVGYWLGSDLVEVLRNGPAIFEMVDLTLGGEPLAQSAVDALGGEEARRVLAILQGPGGPVLIQVAHTVDIFSRYGVIFMLFLIGLETSVQDLRKVGGASLRVAVVGVVAPFVLGFGAARLLMPELSLNVDLFVAATLGATSIGITARVLQELRRLHTPEARIILGAAVIDDVLGLVMLAVVSGIIVSGGIDAGHILQTLLLAGLFLWAAFRLGPRFLDLTIALVRNLDIVEAKMFIAFLFVMALAWLASLAGLSSIVGAFAAGVILHDGYFRYWGVVDAHRFSIRDLIAPLEVIMVPIFFVLMGMQVKLETMTDPHVLYMAGGLIAAALLGKFVSGLVAGRGVRHAAIGVGMMPRGEVGLVFASIGQSLEVINAALFSAVVLMVIVTTLITPPLLKWALGRTPSDAAA